MRFGTITTRRNLGTFGQTALLSLALVLGLPALSHAVVFFQDSYELPCLTAQLAQFTGEACNLTGSSGGLNPPLNMSISTILGFSGIQALQFHYVGTDSGGFADRGFGVSTDHLFIRFMYRPVNMTFNNVGTKILHAGSTAGTQPNFWLNSTTNRQIHFVWQGTADGSNNHLQNVTSTPVNDNQWSCVEAEAKMNTPGVANGEMRLWINGVLALQYTGKLLRGSGNNATFNFYRLYVQHGVGDTYYDLLAAGNTRVGCPGGPADTTPPAAPTNLFVQ